MDEKIEIFKINLETLLTKNELPIAIIYYILKNYEKEIEALYVSHQKKIFENIQNQIDDEQLREDVKRNNPNLKIIKKECEKEKNNE